MFKIKSKKAKSKNTIQRTKLARIRHRQILFEFLSVIFLFSLFSLLSLAYPCLVSASEFSTDYNVTYEFDENGAAQVIQGVTLTNQSAVSYPLNYVLSTQGVTLEEVEASGPRGPLPVEISQNNGAQEIRVNFDNPAAGVGSEYIWQLKYKVRGWAQKVGRIWEINLPRLQEPLAVGKFNLALSIPKIWGPIGPAAPGASQSSIGQDQQTFIYDRSLLGQALRAAFGDFQLFDFSLQYHLKNPSNHKALMEITLPPDLPGQQKVYWKKLDPKPLKVAKDADNNYLAQYLLRPQQELEIEYTGQVVVYPTAATQKLNSEEVSKSSALKSAAHGGSPANSEALEPYLLPAKYWEVNSEEILNLKSKIANLYGLRTDSTDLDWARAIYDYVARTLKYDSSRISDSVERLGAVGALKQPENAICMEFADLTITLLRAAGIPAREVDGYAYVGGDNRPTLNGSLHAWVQFYLPERDWVQIDPTWGATTQSDYFSALDTNRFVLAIKGLDSEKPYPAGVYVLSEKDSDTVVVKPTADFQKDVLPFWLWWQKQKLPNCPGLLGFICS